MCNTKLLSNCFELSTIMITRDVSCNSTPSTCSSRVQAGSDEGGIQQELADLFLRTTGMQTMACRVPSAHALGRMRSMEETASTPMAHGRKVFPKAHHTVIAWAKRQSTRCVEADTQTNLSLNLGNGFHTPTNTTAGATKVLHCLSSQDSRNTQPSHQFLREHVDMGTTIQHHLSRDGRAPTDD
jgi:hypothetical protein